VSTAQLEVLGLTNDTIAEDINLGMEYADKLNQSTLEINQTLRALGCQSIFEPGPATILYVIRKHYQPAGTSIVLIKESFPDE